jgi:hypothetical protein
MFSGTQALPENRGHMFAPKIGTSCLTGQTCGSHRSDRCGQRPRNTIWASPSDRSRRVDQDSYVEHPNWSPDEGDMTYTRSARRVHRSDRCPRVRTKTRSPDRFRLVKGFPCGARPPHPINIKGHGRLRNPTDQINLLLYFYFFPLPYTFPIYYLLFLLRLYVD